MITSFTFVALDSSTLALNEDPPGYPFEHFEVSIDDRGSTDRNKMEQHGVWPTFSYEGGMTMHIEGKIFGADSDDYTTKRLALVNKWRTGIRPTQRKHGAVVVRFDGQSEDWTTDVKVQAFTAPLGGLSPAMSEFAVTFFSYTPWFLGVSTNLKHYYS